MVDPSNQVSLAEKNLIQCIHFTSLLGYLDPEMITDDMLLNPKKCLHVLSNSNVTLQAKWVVSALRYIATLSVKVSGASVISIDRYDGSFRMLASAKRSLFDKFFS